MYDNRYAPAQNEFGQNISIIHFIGENKPWKYQRFADGKVLPLGNTWEGTKHMIQAWWNTWDTYYGQVSSNLFLLINSAKSFYLLDITISFTFW